MKYVIRILTLILCVSLTFSLTACSGSSTDGGAADANVVGGDPQSGITGNWVMLPEDSYNAFSSMSMYDKINLVFESGMISFTADGFYGIYSYYGQFSSYGYYTSEKDGIATYDENSEVPNMNLKQENKSLYTFITEDGESFCMVRISELLPKTELASPVLIGAWEGLVEYDDVQAQRWVVTRDDATWYTVDADGNVTDEGYIISDASVGNTMILFRDEGYYDVARINSSTGAMESNFFGDYAPVEEVPGGSYTPDYSVIYQKYAGYWQYSSNYGIEPLCVLIREDGTYAVIDNTDTVLSNGVLKTTKAGIVTLPLDGTQEITFYPDEEEGLLLSEDYDRLVNLNGSREAAASFISACKEGLLFNERATEWYSFTEDGAWLLRDNLGNTLDSGTVLGDPDDEDMVVLISDHEKYPRIFSNSAIINDGPTDEYGVSKGMPLIGAELDDIPSHARFVGLWTFNHPELSSINILFAPNYYYGGIFCMDGIEINADNTVNDERSYEIMPDPSTGALTFYADNGYSTLRIPVSVSENGALIATDTGESLLVSVDPDAYFDNASRTCIRSNG